MSSPRRVIRLFPDYGHDWPLWEDDHPDHYNAEPADFGLSTELTRELRAWYDEWEHGFDPVADPPRWKPGEGQGWSERGAKLADRLRDEVHDFADVEYDGRPY
jgi:hypothetical protein